MKRTSDKSKPLWRKKTRGTLYLFLAGRGRRTMIKPKQEIRADEEELGAYVDQFDLISEGDGKKEKKVKSTGKAKAAASSDSKEEETSEKTEGTKVEDDGQGYEPKHINGGWFQIQAKGSGKVMHEGKKFRKAEAISIIEQLESEGEEE